MGFLERIGMAPKRPRPRPVGTRLETGKEALLQQAQRKDSIVKILIFAVLILLTYLAFPDTQSYDWANVQVDEVWRKGDVIAKTEFPIRRTEEEMMQEKRRIKATIEPVFTEVKNPRALFDTQADSLQTKLQRAFNTFGSWEISRSRGLIEKARQDSLRYHQLKKQLPLAINERQWSYLLESAKSKLPGVTTSVRNEGGTVLHEQLIRDIRAMKETLYRRPSMGFSRDSLITKNILLRDLEHHIDTPRSVLEVDGLDQVAQFADMQLRKNYTQKPDTVAIGMAFFHVIFHPNWVYERKITQDAWELEVQNISPTRGMVRKDEAIVRQGEVVTKEILQKLRSYSMQHSANADRIPAWRVAIGELILSSIIYLMFFLYIFLFRRHIFARNLHLALLCVLFAVFIVAYGIILRGGLATEFKLIVPTCILAIMLTIVFDSRVGLFGTVAMALQAGLLFAFDYELTFLVSFAGMIAVFSVRDIRNRGQFVYTAGLVHAAYLIGVVGFLLLQSYSFQDILFMALYVSINAVLTLFVYPIIWVIERFFDVTTDLTLLELSDTNRPLLKELSLKAPGTFNHTLQVANLAEAAADAIGANALLTRVGALYHDVGKMSKPEYFIENQMMGLNPLDPLTPRMSALVIANHVKEGLLLAQEYKLPKVVQQFIPMHHGCTRIEYFYRKAMDEHKPEDPPINDADFRYPGPKPQSLETAILMLADGVEAASKSLEKPTLRRLEATIDKIFQMRIADRQLEECPLTFYDLHKIKESFLSILGGMYHFRIKYPGQEDGEPEPTTEERRISPTEERRWGTEERKIPTEERKIP